MKQALLLMDHNSRSKTLGEQVELLYGVSKPTAQLPNTEETRASLNRKQWLDIIGDSSQLLKFACSLSTSQLSSHQLLHEWLTARSEDTEFNLDALDAERAFNTDNFSGSAYALRRHEPTPSRSYHNHLAALLYYEFSHPDAGTPKELHFALLLEVRRTAAIYASCQRLAAGYYHTDSLPTQQGHSVKNPAEHQQVHLTPYGASLEPCFWLEGTQNGETGDDGLPYYLWDVRNQRTVIVRDICKDLQEVPSYLAISHTWGRWMIEQEPPVQLANVPWKIRQNERFTVEDLPNILQKLECSYVWFDLLTIPQGDLSEDLFAIQQTEIARQALIFQNANQVIAWLHDVKTWTALSSAIQYLSLDFLVDTPSRKVEKDTLSKLIERAAMAAAAMPELIFEVEDKRMVISIQKKPNAWFTSLWTLQEACLRPDMMLCTADWQFLKDSKNVPVALNDIAALCFVNAKLQRPTASQPAGVQDLRRMVTSTGLENLLQLSQLSILTMATDRHCLEGRAEAIMSAIGATDWFKGDSNDQVDEALVIELFPLAFVQEVRNTLGSATFFSSTPMGWEFHYVLQKFCEKRIKRRESEEVGSLLPFGPGAHTLAFDIEQNLHMTEHPAVESWCIGNCGYVRIRSAGIVSSTGENQAKLPLRCIVAAPCPRGNQNRLVVHQSIDIHDWVNSYKPDLPNFAVCLFYSPLASQGILLRQIEPGILLKIGSYWQMESPKYAMPESQVVDWLVI